MMKIFNILNISGEMVIYGLIGLMAILLIIIFIMDYKSKKKAINNDIPVVIEGTTPTSNYETFDQMKENFDKECTDEVKEEVTAIEEVPVMPKKEETKEEQEEIEIIEPISHDENIKYVEEDKEKEQQEAKEELKELVQELKEDKDENIELTDFEVEQEESAIISYNELKKVSDSLYDQNELRGYDEGNEPISIDQLRDKFKEVEETPTVEVTTNEEKSSLVETIETLENHEEKKKVKLDDFATKVDDHKFKMSPVISPVYGTLRDSELETIKEDFNASAKLKLEQTANLEKLDEELKKTNEFLKILKELQKKLD